MADPLLVGQWWPRSHSEGENGVGQVWPKGPSVGGTAVVTRSTAVITTASLPASASQNGTVSLAKAYRLFSIAFNVPARIRLYSTDAKRAADFPRASGENPNGDHGLMMDFTSTPELLRSDFSPLVDGFDGKTTPDGLIPYTITNTGTASSVVTVTLVYIREET